MFHRSKGTFKAKQHVAANTKEFQPDSEFSFKNARIICYGRNGLICDIHTLLNRQIVIFIRVPLHFRKASIFCFASPKQASK